MANPASAHGIPDDVFVISEKQIRLQEELQTHATRKAASSPVLISAHSAAIDDMIIDNAFVMSMGEAAAQSTLSKIPNTVDYNRYELLHSNEMDLLDPADPRDGQPEPIIANTEPATSDIAAAETANDPTVGTMTGITVTPQYSSSGGHLTARGGVFYGPSGKETYYNLPMQGVVRIMRNLGYDEAEWPYWVRDDGAKMFGDYIIVAANLTLRPRGTIVETSLGYGIVCDTGGFAVDNPTQLDLALDW